MVFLSSSFTKFHRASAETPMSHFPFVSLLHAQMVADRVNINCQQSMPHKSVFFSHSLPADLFEWFRYLLSIAMCFQLAENQLDREHCHWSRLCTRLRLPPLRSTWHRGIERVSSTYSMNVVVQSVIYLQQDLLTSKWEEKKHNFNEN